MKDALTLHPKATAGATGGTLAVLIVWLLTLCHVQVDAVEAGALASAMAAAGAWLAPRVDAELSPLALVDPPLVSPVPSGEAR